MEYIYQSVYSYNSFKSLSYTYILFMNYKFSKITVKSAVLL